MAITYLQKLQGNRLREEENQEVMALLGIWGLLYAISNKLIVAGGFTYEDKEYKYIQEECGQYFIDGCRVAEHRFFKMRKRVEAELLKRNIALKNINSSEMTD